MNYDDLGSPDQEYLFYHPCPQSILLTPGL